MTAVFSFNGDVVPHGYEVFQDDDIFKIHNLKTGEISQMNFNDFLYFMIEHRYDNLVNIDIPLNEKISLKLKPSDRRSPLRTAYKQEDETKENDVENVIINKPKTLECECGAKITIKRNMQRHLSSRRHIFWLMEKNNKW